MKTPTRILIVEDRAADADLARRAIRKVIKDCEFQVVETRKDFLAALEVFQPDLILSDYSLPHFDGMKALRLAVKHAPLTPLIIWTGSISEDVAVECMKAGANNYVIKENIKRLGPAVIHALEERELLVARKQAEEKYQAIFENSVAGVFQSTPAGRYLNVNAAMARIYGYDSPREMVEAIESIADQIYVEPGRRDEFVRLINSQDAVENYEERNYRKDGSIIWTSASARTVRDPNGNILYYEGFITDITERKRAEEALTEERTRLRTLIDTIPDEIYIKDAQSRFLNANMTVARIHGFSTPEELIGKTDFDLDAYEGASADFRTEQAIIQTGQSIINLETSNRDQTRWRLETKVPLRDSQGQIVGLVGVNRFITERKQAEEALHHSLEETKHAQHLLLRVSEVGQVIQRAHSAQDVYRAICEGLSSLGYRVSILTLTEDQKHLTLAHTTLSLKLIDAIEKIVGFSVWNYRFPLDDESFLRKAFYKDEATLTPLDEEEIAKLLPRLLRPLAHGILSLIETYSVIFAPIVVRDEPYSLLVVDGPELTELDLLPIATFAVQASIALENAQLYESLQQELYERKQAEARINDLLAFNEKVLNHSSVGILIYKLTGECVFANENAASILGARVEQLRAQNFHTIESWKESGLYDLVEKAISTQKTVTSDVHIVSTFGKDVWMTVHCVTFKSKDEDHLLLTISDITERKRAEEALRQSEARLILALSGAQMSVWEWNLQTNQMLWSPEFFEIAGVREDEFDRTFEAFTQLIHSDDVERVTASAEKAMTERTLFAEEFRVIRPNGEVRWLSNLGHAEYDPTMNYLRLIGTVQDITQRKQAEIERQVLLEIMQGLASTKDLQELLKLIHHSIARVIYAENFFVTLHQPDSGLFEEIYSVDQYDPIEPPSKLEKSLTAYVFHSGEPILLTQAGFEELVAQGKVKLIGTKPASWLGVPLKTSGGIIGMIAVQDYENPNRYSEHDKDFLVSIASQVALAIERKRAEESLTLFRSQIDQIKDTIEVIDPETGRYIDVNEQACRLHGYTREEFLALTIDDIDPLEAARPEPIRDRLLHSGSLVFESLHRCKDGSTFPVEVNLNYIRLDREYNLAVVRDITERKRAESALRQAEEKYRNIFENSILGIYQTSPAGQFFTANPALAHMLGYSSSEEVIASVTNLNRNFYVNPLRRADFERALEENDTVSNFESEIYKKDGSQMWISENGRAVRDARGTLLYYEGTTIDITERKQAEQGLMESVAQFRTLFEASPDAILLIDPHGDWPILDCNPSACQMNGYARNELVGQSIDILNPTPGNPVERAEYMQKIRELGILRYETIHHRKDGNVIAVEVSTTLIQFGQREIVLGIDRDITERKQAEEALKRSHSLQYATLESTADGILVVEANGKISNFNQKFLELWRIPRELAEQSDDRILLEFVVNQLKDPSAFISKVEALYQSPEATSFDELDFCDGRVFERFSQPQKLGNDIMGRVWSFRDVTERKRAEQALLRREQQLEEAQRLGHIGSWEWDIQTSTGTWSNEMYRLYDLDPQQLRPLNLEEIIAQVHPDDKERVTQLLGQAYHARQPFSFDYRTLRTDGSIRWMYVRGEVVVDNMGQPIHVQGITQDITERRQAEEALRESEERFSSAFEFAPIGKALVAPDGRFLKVNYALSNLVGYTKQELLQKTFQEITHPEDLEADLNHVNQMLRKEIDSYQIEKRYIHKSGNIVWALLSVSLVNDSNGEPQYFIAQIQDINQRKKSEMEIRRHVAELEALYENGLAVGHLLKPSEIGNRVIDTFASYLLWHHVTIRLKKEETDELELVAFNLPHLKEEERAETEQHFTSLVSRVGQGLSGWVMETGMPLRTGNVHAHPQYVGSYEGIQSGLYMPLIVGDRVIGVISVESETPNDFTEQDERLLATLANQTAIAFENARLYNAIQKELVERKRAEEALRASEAHYRELADSITDILFELDQNLYCTHWNKASETLLGIPVDDAIGRSMREIFGESEEQTRIERIYEAVLSDHQPRTFETTFVLNEEARSFEINAYPSTRGISVVAKDVTERKQMEVALETERNQLARRVEERTADLSRANSNLARALRVKDEFLANMSHELRTPLNAILGLSESLGEQIAGPLNEKQQKYITTISESGHHLLSLINDILDLAKIESGQITLDINKVDIHSVCQASLRMIKQLAQKKNQEVSLEIDDGLGLMWADERRLKQMIVNLLSNAVKFTPENGKLGLEVHGDETENKITIMVWDNGIGIKEEDLARLFQPFVQLDSGLAREAAGTGLGLALVAQMARLHGGSVNVHSEPEKGSRFSIVLPWQPALAMDTADRLRITGKFRAIKFDKTNMPTILLVEDTQEVIMMLKDYLELAGYKVVTAQDGVEALIQARLVRPDLILMDLQMPRMDGLETTRKLRSEPDFKYTPIIALTALAMPSDRERCLAAGMDEYMSKPINLKALVKIIQSCLFNHDESQQR